MEKHEVELLVEQKTGEVWKYISKDSAPYLSVEYFFLSLGIFVTVLSALLGFMWKKLSATSQRIHERVDEVGEQIENVKDKLVIEMEETEDKLRSEFSKKDDRINDRIWDLALRKQLPNDKK